MGWAGQAGAGAAEREDRLALAALAAGLLRCRDMARVRAEAMPAAVQQAVRGAPWRVAQALELGASHATVEGGQALTRVVLELFDGLVGHIDDLSRERARDKEDLAEAIASMQKWRAREELQQARVLELQDAMAAEVGRASALETDNARLREELSCLRSETELSVRLATSQALRESRCSPSASMHHLPMPTPTPTPTATPAGDSATRRAVVEPSSFEGMPGSPSPSPRHLGWDHGKRMARSPRRMASASSMEEMADDRSIRTLFAKRSMSHDWLQHVAAERSPSRASRNGRHQHQHELAGDERRDWRSLANGRVADMDRVSAYDSARRRPSRSLSSTRSGSDWYSTLSGDLDERDRGRTSTQGSDLDGSARGKSFATRSGKVEHEDGESTESKSDFGDEEDDIDAAEVAFAVRQRLDRIRLASTSR